MRLLFLSRWYPYPANNGSKLRIYNLLRGLAQHHEVTLLSFAEQSDILTDTSVLGSLCREVQVVPWKPFNPNSRRARLDFLNSAPRSVVDTFSPEVAYGCYFHWLPALFKEAEVRVLYEH